ncbi:DUF4037 domain-containing protein [Ectobacillus ponti]|uniref:DUF4037 domain-containing protein n=1 Tax=Ectobacillus ponti TaxID=2961894 RepID=A0AA41X9S2_9BACI|nr:DUF4037 domain-containing protein [Ectobacillus ponti]
MDIFTKTAERVAGEYGKLGKVEGVMLTGSVSRGWQDLYSDIELYVLWKEAPEEEDRTAVAKALGGEVLQLHPYEEGEWADVYMVDGIKLEISGFLPDTVEQWIYEVTEQYDTDISKQHVLASIADGRALLGEGLIVQWKKQCAAYPAGLMAALMEEHLETTGRWSSRYALLHRKDVLMLQAVKCQVLQQLWTLLFAVNRQYIPHPLFKWSRQYAKLLPVMPQDFQKRAEHVLTQLTEESVEMLETMRQEVYDLVEAAGTPVDKVYRHTFIRPVQ